MFKISTISNSLRFEGFNFLLNSTTLLSKKYNPVIARFEKDFFGFSLIDIIFPFLFILATPYNSGLLTGCTNTLHPALSFTQFFNLFVRL